MDLIAYGGASLGVIMAASDKIYRLLDGQSCTKKSGKLHKGQGEKTVLQAGDWIGAICKCYTSIRNKIFVQKHLWNFFD